jgi:hypothetical protein
VLPDLSEKAALVPATWLAARAGLGSCARRADCSGRTRLLDRLRADVPIAQLDVEALTSGHLADGADSASPFIAHQGEAALEDSLVAER